MNGEGGEQGEMESLSAREREVSLNFSIKQRLAKRKHQQSLNMFNQVKSSNVSFFLPSFQTPLQINLSSWTPAVHPHVINHPDISVHVQMCLF